MAKRMTVEDMCGLPPQRAAYIIEYLKDFNSVRAADAVGIHPSTASDWRNEPKIQEVMSQMLARRLENSDITAEWALMEAVDNHRIARQEGKLSASNTALRLVMQHAAVDAFAAEKVFIAADEAIKERLLRGRARAAGDEVSFL